MSKIDIVVGGQFGSEGKGKAAYALAMSSVHKCVARIGGSNSGHTVIGNILRHLPAAALIPNGISIIGSGSYIDIDILLAETEKFKPFLLIDNKAHIIQYAEPKKLFSAIGSTLSGTGQAVKDRITRLGNAKSVATAKKLSNYLTTSAVIQDTIKKGCIIEGTQGFGLSVLHSPYYPYVTSRDTTASGFISELGVSPKNVGKIFLVIRTFPIRVGGNSGPLPNECSWKDIGVQKEYTSVTGRIRRVAKFDPEIVIEAIAYNNPTHIILNHLDYIPKLDRQTFITYVEEAINRKINYVGLGPNIIYKI